MVTEQAILDALKTVLDPEIGMSVVDLGLIRRVVVDEAKVEIEMVLTGPSCPMAGFILEHVRQAANAVPGVEEARVTLLNRPWDPSWMKKQGG